MECNTNSIANNPYYINSRRDEILEASRLFDTISSFDLTQRAIDVLNDNIKMLNEAKRLLNLPISSFSSLSSNLESSKKVSTQKKEGCFIATACYGDYNHPKVTVLREFRDQVLVRYFFGRAFISFYYATSPAFAKRIQDSEIVKKLLRFILINPLIKLIN